MVQMVTSGKFQIKYVCMRQIKCGFFKMAQVYNTRMKEENHEALLSDSNYHSPKETKYKDYDYIFKVVLNISLASAYCGYTLAYFNTINFDHTIQIFNIHHDRAVIQGLLTFCIAIGAAAGGYLATFVIRRFSRKDGFLFVAYVAIGATLLLQSSIIEIIFICRVVQGITVGMTTAMRPLYIKEFVPIEIAGKFGTINQLLFAIGLIFTFVQTYLLSLFLTPHQYWRIVYFTPIIFMAIQVYNLKVTFPHETPKYLLEQGRREEAEQLVRLLYKSQYVEQRMHELDKMVDILHGKKDVEMLTSSQRGAIVAISGAKSNRIAMYTAYLISILQQVTGIQIVILYAGEILLTIAPSLQKILPIFLQTQGFVVTLFTMQLLGTYGRKFMIQRGLLIMAGVHFIISLAYYWKSSAEEHSDEVAMFPSIIIIVSLIVFRGVFSLTIGPILWLYLPEIVEPDVISISTMLNWLTAAFVAFIFPVFVELFGGPEQIFAIIGILILIGWLLNQRWMVQTKDKPQWQIRKQYDAKL